MRIKLSNGVGQVYTVNYAVWCISRGVFEDKADCDQWLAKHYTVSDVMEIKESLVYKTEYPEDEKPMRSV